MLILFIFRIFSFFQNFYLSKKDTLSIIFTYLNWLDIYIYKLSVTCKKLQNILNLNKEIIGIVINRLEDYLDNPKQFLEVLQESDYLDHLWYNVYMENLILAIYIQNKYVL